MTSTAQQQRALRLCVCWPSDSQLTCLSVRVVNLPSSPSLLLTSPFDFEVVVPPGVPIVVRASEYRRESVPKVFDGDGACAVILGQRLIGEKQWVK